MIELFHQQAWDIDLSMLIQRANRGGFEVRGSGGIEYLFFGNSICDVLVKMRNKAYLQASTAIQQIFCASFQY